MKINASPSNEPRPLQDSLTRASQGSTTSGATEGASAASTQSAASGSTASNADSADVVLSSVSSSLRALAASGSSDVDTAKVASIKDAISNGTLQIDSGAIADGMLNSARSLVQSSSGT